MYSLNMMIPRHAPEGVCIPDFPKDLLDDVLREAIDRWKGDLPSTIAEFKLIVLAIAKEAIKVYLDDDDSDRTLPPRERETIARLVSEFIDSDNPRLVAQCYDFACGLGLQMGITETTIAKEHGLGKAAVSKRCRAIIRDLEIHPARGMKSPETINTYRQKQVERHAKKKRCAQPWHFATQFTQGFLTAGT